MQRMRPTIVRRGWPLFVFALAASPEAAQASFPVPYALVGCMSGGKFVSEQMSGPALQSEELKRLEGKTIRIEGYLSPGDRFEAHAIYIVDQRCRPHRQRSYFLCNPCQTNLGQPQSEILPDQGGTKVLLPPAIVRDLDDYPRRMSP